ncbi:hypothetical protein OGATHE_000743 [Ogataea polymorpha]|uniref:Uncharacterized protein n=1 Tax=Ogataea polymorpha TaxID=460523 RepID=A0A9P8PTF3_9ASCO|nr:hypothetical protein OGATHE_000743 [Ogataea polymorpha]
MVSQMNDLLRSTQKCFFLRVSVLGTLNVFVIVVPDCSSLVDIDWNKRLVWSRRVALRDVNASIDQTLPGGVRQNGQSVWVWAKMLVVTGNSTHEDVVGRSNQVFNFLVDWKSLEFLGGS